MELPSSSMSTVTVELGFSFRLAGVSSGQNPTKLDGLFNYLLRKGKKENTCGKKSCASTGN